MLSQSQTHREILISTEASSQCMVYLTFIQILFGNFSYSYWHMSYMVGAMDAVNSVGVLCGFII